MAIKITIGNLVTFAVKGVYNDEAGNTNSFEFLLTAKRLTQPQLQSELESDPNRKTSDLMTSLIVGWKRVLDDEGNEVPFSADALAMLFSLRGLPDLAFARYLAESGDRKSVV